MNTYHIGIDMGGTKCSGIILNDRGEELVYREVPVRKKWNPRQLRAMLASLITDLIARADVKERRVRTLGIGVPAVLNERGTIQKAVNLPAIERVSFEGLLPRAKTSVWNDTVCAAFAESMLGSLANARNGVHLMLGTGLGGATMTRLNESGIFGTRIIMQITNIEIGHVAANIETALVGTLTNEPYELEAYCSRAFFKRNTKRRCEELYDTFWEGDVEARDLFVRFGANIGVLLANVETLFRPDTIVLGGGMTAYLPAYERTMKRIFRERRFLTRKPANVRRATFGPEVGALGAALYGMVAPKR